VICRWSYLADAARGRQALREDDMADKIRSLTAAANQLLASLASR